MTKLTRWTPFNELSRMREDMDKLFNEAFTRLPGERSLLERVEKQPSVDLYETDNEIVAKADLPGFNREDINISVTEDTLSIFGETREEKEVEEENYYCKERRWGKVNRVFNLPKPIDPDNVKATFKEGILEIKMAKTEKGKGKPVNIEIE